MARITLTLRVVLYSLLATCAYRGTLEAASLRSVETLDQHTGMTVGAMPKPLVFTETGIFDLLEPDKQPSVIYLGPVEWDRSGDLTYVLWVQVAPGVGGHRLDDLQARGAVALKLDGQLVPLTVVTAPNVDQPPYRLIEPVGETAYFHVDPALLERMAASHKLVLTVRAGDLSPVEFVPSGATRAALQEFISDRGIVE